jgi:hypothetical protein
MDYRGMIYRTLPLAAFILMVLVAGASAITYYFDAKAKIANSLTLSSPVANATIVVSTTVNDSNGLTKCNGTSWYDSMFVDGVQISDCNFNSCVFNPAPFTVGSHTLQIYAHTINGTPPAVPGVLCDSTNYITIYANATRYPDRNVYEPSDIHPLAGCDGSSPRERGQYRSWRNAAQRFRLRADGEYAVLPE